MSMGLRPCTSFLNVPTLLNLCLWFPHMLVYLYGTRWAVLAVNIACWLHNFIKVFNSIAVLNAKWGIKSSLTACCLNDKSSSVFTLSAAKLLACNVNCSLMIEISRDVCDCVRLTCVWILSVLFLKKSFVLFQPSLTTVENCVLILSTLPAIWDSVDSTSENLCWSNHAE